MSDGLKLVLQRIERAKEQRTDIEREMRAWAGSGEAYRVATRLDPQTGNTFFYVDRVGEITPLITALTGEIIHTLRTALDHLAYQLFLVCRTDATDEGTAIEFPIYDDSKRTEDHAFRPVKSFRKEIIEMIRAVKPYKGGNSLLWVLHRLDIVDKHRRILTNLVTHHSVFMGDAARQLLVDRGYADMAPLIRRDIFRTSVRTGHRAQVGDIVFIGMPGDEKANEKLQFTFDITFDEPGIIEGKSMIQTVDAMVKLVEGVVSSFEPFLV